MTRLIAYRRHEFHAEPEARTAELGVFLFDIPYFGACGVFPPHHLLNSFLASGGADGGMGPGATWSPFTVTEIEYKEVIEMVIGSNKRLPSETARYGEQTFVLDPALDSHTNYEEWLMAACAKHRKPR